MASELLAPLKAELGISASSTSSDSELEARLASATAEFADATFRDLGAPAGDPDVTIVRPCNGGVVRLPDARSVAAVEYGPRRAGSDWTAATDYDLQPWVHEGTAVWLTLPTDTPAQRELASAAFVRVTGKFGMHPLPKRVQDAIVALAAHRHRARGGNATGEWEMPDGGVVQTFARLPPEYMAAVKLLRVPQGSVGWVEVP